MSDGKGLEKKASSRFWNGKSSNEIMSPGLMLLTSIISICCDLVAKILLILQSHLLETIDDLLLHIWQFHSMVAINILFGDCSSTKPHRPSYSFNRRWLSALITAIVFGILFQSVASTPAETSLNPLKMTDASEFESRFASRKLLGMFGSDQSSEFTYHSDVTDEDQSPIMEQFLLKDNGLEKLSSSMTQELRKSSKDSAKLAQRMKDLQETISTDLQGVSDDIRNTNKVLSDEIAAAPEVKGPPGLPGSE